MSFDYDKETDTLYVKLTHHEQDKSYRPKSENFRVYLEKTHKQDSLIIKDISNFLAEMKNAGVPTADADQKPVWEDVDSSMISAFKYDPATEILEVAFNRTGIYQYSDVPADVVDGLRDASSKGSYMRSMIINVYGYAKL